ncbi:MAG: hypothetical protein K2P81_16240 [Bacteriovoracaceae bacterium]|nr:hypothetical protein [Bacteriovoracaceae bacterium]
MKAAKSIATLYKIVKETSGDIEAKNFVTDILFNILSDLHEQNIPVSEESIEKLLEENAQDFIQASKNHVA